MSTTMIMNLLLYPTVRKNVIPIENFNLVTTLLLFLTNNNENIYIIRFKDQKILYWLTKIHIQILYIKRCI